MAELYDNIKLANSRFVPRFVGSAREELKSVADTLDARYRANRDLSDKLAIQMANDKYLAEDQAIGDKIYKDFSGLIDRVASSDENFENSTGIIANAARDYGTNQDRILALDNARRYEKYLADKALLGAEAVDFTPTYRGVKNADGTYNRFRPELQKKLDYDKQKEQYFNQIEADLKQQGYTQDQINAEFLKSTITGGISDSKIGEYTKKAFTRHATTAEYQQEKRVLMQQGLTSEEADTAIKKSLLATGLERVHGISKEDLQRHSEAYLRGIYGDGNTPPPEPFVPTVPGASKTNTAFSPLVTADSKFYHDQQGQAYQVFDKNGTPVDVKEAEESFRTIKGAGGGGKFTDFYDLRPINVAEAKASGSYDYQYDYLTKNMSERQKQMLQKRLGNKSWTVEEFVKEHQDGGKNFAQIVESGEQLTKENTPIYENYLRGAGMNAPTILEGESTPKTLKEIVSGIDGKVEVVPTLLNRTSPNPQMGSNIEGIIYVDGKPTKAFVTRLSDQFDAASNDLNDILQNSLYKGSDTYTKDKPKVSGQVIRTDKGDYVPVYYTTTVPTGNAGNPFDTEVHVGLAKIGGIQPNGTPIIESPEYGGESYTAREFIAKQTEVSKRRLKNVYGSGQMRDLDLKSFGTE